MKNKPQETDPINYMIARRRPKIKRSVWKNPLFKTSVSLAAITAVIGSGVLVCGMVLKKWQNTPVRSYKTMDGLSHENVSAITHPIDVELYALIEEYQNFNRLSPRMAVDNALYDMWCRFDVDYKNNPSEEARICLTHITKRSKQANRVSLSNKVGDENPFLEMVYNETYKQLRSDIIER